MIFWIASYPKSGNTWLRLLITNYLWPTNNSNQFESLKNIEIFPQKKFFEGIVDEEVLKKDRFEIFKHYVSAQDKINLNDELNILKTHTAAVSIKNDPFTNPNNSCGAVYIVRDPRSVLISSKYHYNFDNYEIAMEHILSDKRLTYVNNNILPEFLLSWKSHYISWRKFYREYPNLGLIIKFEDLIAQPEKMFLKILNFIQENSISEIDNKKFNNSLRSIQFKNLQSIEKTQGFDERRGQAKYFFRKGVIDEWKKEVPDHLLKVVEKEFNQEMKELGYL